MLTLPHAETAGSLWVSVRLADHMRSSCGCGTDGATEPPRGRHTAAGARRGGGTDHAPSDWPSRPDVTMSAFTPQPTTPHWTPEAASLSLESHAPVAPSCRHSQTALRLAAAGRQRRPRRRAAPSRAGTRAGGWPCRRPPPSATRGCPGRLPAGRRRSW